MLQSEIAEMVTSEYMEKRLHPIAELAMKAIREYIKNRRVISPPEEIIPEMGDRCGVFVSLKKDGRLRGCIGTYIPTKNNVAEEIIQNAISAATMDPRFMPVSEEELDEIAYSVDILSECEKIKEISDLDPKRYGIIIQRGARRGLLLPDLDGVDSPHEQISIAREKAGIDPEEPVEILRFEVKRFK